MAVITIDGVTLTADDNQNVLEAALDNGIYIPHLCHHKDLNPLGSCRMCIVEVEGQKGVVPSCELKAADGLIIHTKTEEINRLRMLGLELLLAGHPEECTTCPKYGNCELQMLIQYIGPKTGRLKLRTKGFKEQTDNPLIIHDMNRCVLCGRCVRACNELRGVGVLEYKKRDMETYIGTLHDKLLKEADCRFCGACAEVCPTGTIRDKLMDAEVKKEDAVVPCRHACPAHTDIPRYIRHVKNGEYDEAAAVLREKLPFPISLGYICTHVCELACKRKDVNEAMSIKEIKRFAAEHDSGIYWRGKGKHLPDTGKKVCVVGGGPAGLSAAYYLQKQGHEVTVKEELPTMGGMMAYGIPAYRMPREIVQEEVDLIAETGVHMETNVKVESPELLLQEYDAVLMAIGGHKGVVLPMEGHDLNGILLNTQFLRNVSMNQETGIGSKVVVLGGGNVAFDCARSAVRLGAETVHVACLEKREAMTADHEEIEQAVEEGVQVHPGRTFERITGETAVTGVELMKVKSFTFDENRRAVIEKEEDSEYCIEADTVIFAVGQRPDITEASGLNLGRGNSVEVKDIEKDKRTSVEGVFAAGDVIYGTKSVIMAVQSGKEAASQIDRYLGGDGDISEVLAPVGKKDSYIGKVPRFSELERKPVVIEPAEKRRNNFKLFDYGICESDICGEASRCLQCDLRMDISKPRVWGDYVEKAEV
jgi:formate dehydrogenase beta subunit